MHSGHTNEEEECVIHNHEHKFTTIDNVVHHNTSSADIKGIDKDLFKTIILSASRREGIFAIANISRKTL